MNTTFKQKKLMIEKMLKSDNKYSGIKFTAKESTMVQVFKSGMWIRVESIRIRVPKIHFQKGKHVSTIEESWLRN